MSISKSSTTRTARHGGPRPSSGDASRPNAVNVSTLNNKKERSAKLDTVISIPPNLSGSESESDSETVSSHGSGSGSSLTESRIDGEDSSHEDTLGVKVTDRPDPMRRIDTQKLIKPQSHDRILPEGAERYSAVRATWPGSLAYAASFMAARLAQFALTATGNTQGAALAFASLAGVLHIGVEPLVGALRERMGMRGDNDSANYTNYVTAMTDFVECQLRCDQKGADEARKVARGILDKYGFDCAYDDKLPADQQKPMPGFWKEAITMLKAGARGIASNELPFYSFAVVYMLTNPAGLWTRSTLLSVTGSDQLAKASELLFSLAGGILSGAATVGAQNILREKIQSTQHAPARRTIKLDRLNSRNLEMTQQSLRILKEAVKDALDRFDDASALDADHSGIEDRISDHLYQAHVRPSETEVVTAAICAELEQLPRDELEALQAEIKLLRRTSKQPYSFGSAVGDKYMQMVATKDKQGVYQPDSGKVRRLVARTAGNVAGLMVYSMAMVQAIDTVSRYAPANLSAQGHGNQTSLHPASQEEAYGQMASLGWTLITCWVAGRALVPPVADLVLAPVTSGMKGLAHLGQTLWASYKGGPDHSTQAEVDIV